MQANSTLAGKALRSMSRLVSLIKCCLAPIDISFNLFDSYVLNYNLEVWGSIKAEVLKKVQREFRKWSNAPPIHCLFIVNLEGFHFLSNDIFVW